MVTKGRVKTTAVTSSLHTSIAARVESWYQSIPENVIDTHALCILLSTLPQLKSGLGQSHLINKLKDAQPMLWS